MRIKNLIGQKFGRLILFLVFVLLLATMSYAQVINLTGGDSTVMNAVGGSAAVYLPNSETRIGYGIMDGRPVFGLTELTKLRGANLTGGDMVLPAALPSDFSGGSFGFYARGVSVERARSDEDKPCAIPVGRRAPIYGVGARKCFRGTSKLLVFAGQTSQFYGFPMTFGSKMTHDYVSMLSYERTLSDHWTFNSFEIAASRQTAIQSIDWHPFLGTHAAISAGVGNNGRYFGALFDTRKKFFAAKIGYTNSASDFRLLKLPNALLVQNSGLSGQAAVTPTKWLGFTASQIHYQTPVNNTSLRSTVDTFGAFTNFRSFDFHESDYLGLTEGRHNNGKEFGAGIRLRDNAISIRSDYSTSAFGYILLNTVSERVTQKFRIAQYINTTAQGTTVNIGGSYSGNALSISISWEQEFFPYATGRNPFATTLNASISVHIKNASINLATLTNPDGGTRYTAYAGTYLYGPIETYSSGAQRHSLGGKLVVTGLVTLADGSPVQGAAIVITDRKGKAGLVWSDSTGRFEAHVRSAQEYAVAVSLDDFTTPETYSVRECPASVRAAKSGQDLESTIHIVLLRRQP